jgi:hypothetical protein
MARIFAFWMKAKSSRRAKTQEILANVTGFVLKLWYDVTFTGGR